jgi:hypothetical protein
MAIWGGLGWDGLTKRLGPIVPGLSSPVPRSHVTPAIPPPHPKACRRLSRLRRIRLQAQHEEHPASLEDRICPKDGHIDLPPHAPGEDPKGQLLTLEQLPLPLGGLQLLQSWPGP